MDFTSKDKVLRLLEQAAASLDGSTGEDLGPAFKRYRQAVFKLNYKINKLNAAKRGAAKVRARFQGSNLSALQQAGVVVAGSSHQGAAVLCTAEYCPCRCGIASRLQTACL